MKKILKETIIIFIKIITFLIHPVFVKTISFIIRNINTYYILKQLKSCGNNPSMLFPITTHGLDYISIGDNFSAGARLRIEAYGEHLDHIYTPNIFIGDNVNIGYDCHIGCVNEVVIGNNVLIASKVFISDHSHGDTNSESLIFPPNSRKVISKGPVIVEDNVWIGEGVSIMPNIIIGKNSIIGANSVVTKNVPKNCVACGNPAKIIKELI